MNRHAAHRPTDRLFRPLLLLLAALTWTSAGTVSARAGTFAVNSTADAADASPGDGVCATSGGVCTLRAAIQESNASPAFPPDMIDLPAGTYVLNLGRLDVNTSLSIAGSGADLTIIDGNGTSGIFSIANPGTDPIVNISGVTIRNGDSGISSGAGIHVSEGSSLSLTHSVVRDNRSSVGGVGISNSGFLTITGSTIRDNAITGGGGGVTGTGAGIFNTSVGTARIIESTISNNQGIRGGGIANSGSLHITNSTISGNVASAGGGLYNFPSGVVNVSFSTITDNEAGLVTGEPASQRVGGGVRNVSGQLNFGNTILAGNRDRRTAADPLYAPDCFSRDMFRFTSFRGNVLGVLNENCIFRDTIWGDTRFDLVGTEEAPLDPQVGPLAENGGPTRTHALLAGSPAIDEGTGVTSATFFDCPETDQRGFVRPVDGDSDSTPDCDVGSFEFGAVSLDDTPPVCEIAGIDPGPPTTLRIRIQDAESGFAAVNVLQERNATVIVPAFIVASTDVMIVTATKIAQPDPAVVELEVRDVAGNVTRCDPVVATVSAEVPESFELEQNFPNPFNPNTTIRFHVAEKARVSLEIVDVLGRRIATLVDREMQPGTYTAEWDGRDGAGLTVAGGAYIYRIRMGSFVETKVMTLLK